MIRASSITRAPAFGSVTLSVTLTHAQRFLRRRCLQMDSGEAFLVDLPKAVLLGQGEAFELEDGRMVVIVAAKEALLEITGPDLARLAWHIGNRHTPCQIGEYRLLILKDPVLAEMLRGLGADVNAVEEPFSPEGGAYGHAQTRGHDH